VTLGEGIYSMKKSLNHWFMRDLSVYHGQNSYSWPKQKKNLFCLILDGKSKIIIWKNLRWLKKIKMEVLKGPCTLRSFIFRFDIESRKMRYRLIYSFFFFPKKLKKKKKN